MTTKSTIVVNDDLVREPNHLLEAETALSYDTTFNLGNFYVSVLSFRHTMLKNSKHNTSFTIPVAFMTHDLPSDHESKQRCIQNYLSVSLRTLISWVKKLFQ